MFNLKFNNDGPVTDCPKSLDGFRCFMAEYHTNSSLVMLSSWIQNFIAVWCYTARSPSISFQRVRVCWPLSFSFPVSHFPTFLSASLFAYSTFLFSIDGGCGQLLDDDRVTPVAHAPPYRARSFQMSSKPPSRCWFFLPWFSWQRCTFSRSQLHSTGAGLLPRWLS